MSPRRRIATMVVASAALLLVPFAAGAAPVVSITGGPSGVVASTSASFTFDVDDGSATVECSFDGGGFSPCTGSASTSGLGQGDHTFTVQATNVDGPSSASRSWTVDTAGPSFSQSDITADATGGAGANVTFTPDASDPHGPVSVNCSPASNTSFPIGMTPVSCTATDGLGNTTSGSFTVTVRDATPPTLTLPGPMTVSVNAALSTTVTYSATAHDGGAPWTPACTPASGDSFNLGTTTVTCIATDGDGNVASGTFTVTVQDTTDPTVSITGGPTGTVGSASANITFGTNEGSLTCALDGASYSPCSSPANLTGLSAGAHTFHVRATDVPGNVGNASRTWTVDTAPPTFTAPAEISVEANSAGGSVVSFTVTAADDGVPLLPGAVTCTPPSKSVFRLGTTTVQCTAADSFGNVGTVSFPVGVHDTTKPTLLATDITLAATSASGIRRTDPAMKAFLSSLRGTDLISAVEVTTNAPLVLPIGKTLLLVRAVDGAGNATAKTITVTVLAFGLEAPPPPDLDPPAAVTQLRASAKDHKVTLTWVNPNAPDLDRIMVRMTQSDGNGAERVVSRDIRSTTTATGLRNGAEYRFVVTAVDKAGNESRGAVVLATPKAVLLVSPKPGTKVTKPPQLRWAPTPSASYYNVQLFRGKVKILSAWPTRARMQLGRTWMYDKARRTLGRGTYTWYVWPGFGPRVDVKYGTVIGKSTFVVVAPKSDL